jgi:hypothetical protein
MNIQQAEWQNVTVGCLLLYSQEAKCKILAFQSSLFLMHYYQQPLQLVAAYWHC